MYSRELDSELREKISLEEQPLLKSLEEECARAAITAVVELLDNKLKNHSSEFSPELKTFIAYHIDWQSDLLEPRGENI
jgi:hypothetical protein